MATQNPFANMFSQNAFQNPFADAFKGPVADAVKSFSEFKTPNFDMNHAVSFGRKNAEAASAATQAVAESVQAIARRQAELARAHVEKMLKTSREMLVNGSPEINTTRQIELARSVFEGSLSNVRELSELVTKSGFEVFDVLNRRAAEGLQEMTNVAASTKKKAA